MRTLAIGFCTALFLVIVGLTTEVKQVRPIDVNYDTLSAPVQKQIDCLAQNIYYEAGYEPVKGQEAVAMVTMNRLVSGNFSDSVCKVVKQKTGSLCQFSWWCASKKPVNKDVYLKVRDVAVKVYMNYDNMHDVTKGATFYHADYVKPGWKLNVTTKIGHHIFYKRERDYNAKQTKSSFKQQRLPSTKLVYAVNGGNKSPDM